MTEAKQGAGASKALDYFLRHLVALTVKVQMRTGEEQADAFTCFVMEIRDQWFLVTAGHVLKGLEAALKDERYTILEWGLFDAWNPAQGGRTQVPFNFEESQRFFIDDDKAGLDLGVIAIPPFLRRTLSTNGIAAFEPKTWRGIPDDLERYLIVGMPQEFIEPSTEKGVLQFLKVEPVIVSVAKCDEPEDLKKPFKRFYGRLAAELSDEKGEVLRDISGMSGGPVIGLRKQSDGVAYFLVAIQGSWSPQLRVVAGSYAVALGIALEVELERVAQPATTSDGAGESDSE